MIGIVLVKNHLEPLFVLVHIGLAKTAIQCIQSRTIFAATESKGRRKMPDGEWISVKERLLDAPAPPPPGGENT